MLLAGIPHHHRLPGMLRWCPVDLHIRSVRLSLSSILLKYVLCSYRQCAWGMQGRGWRVESSERRG